MLCDTITPICLNILLVPNAIQTSDAGTVSLYVKARNATYVPSSIQNLIIPMFSHISKAKMNDSSVSFFV